MHRPIRIVAEVHGASLQRELVAAGLGIRLIPEAVARTWTSRSAKEEDLVIVKPKGESVAIAAALIWTTTLRRGRGGTLRGHSHHRRRRAALQSSDFVDYPSIRRRHRIVVEIHVAVGLGPETDAARDRLRSVCSR
jgi:hypothetical protein